MAIQRKKTRMYEPWGYRDENNYESAEIIHENDLESFFADVNYNKDDNKIYFYNKDGEEKGALDVSEFVKSDSIIDKVEYKDGILTITFTNGDEIHIDLSELIDENEFGDGLIYDESDRVVRVLIDGQSERWLTVSENGIKISGIQDEIDRLDGRVDAEISRAITEEERIESKLDQEIQNRIDDVDAEENRAKEAEQVLTTNLSNEITRATRTEQGLNHRIDVINDELDAEESIRESNDAALSLRITTEVNDRIAAVNAEKTRAEATETIISGAVNNLSSDLAIEVQRAKDEEEAINERIDELISGGSIDKLDELIKKLGYKDNDTLQLTNEHEVAFGEWNVSNTSADASGQTVFSIGIGTSESDRKNAFEVRKDGSLWATVEGEYLDITKILGQLTHEIYNADANGNY